MIIVIGEILMDIFPAYRQMGGAPFNFAYHLQKFGFPVGYDADAARDAWEGSLAFYRRLFG